MQTVVRVLHYVFNHFCKS